MKKRKKKTVITIEWNGDMADVDDDGDVYPPSRRR
jgi:hypothetical protein